MLIITHHIKTSSDFMDRYLPDGPAGGFFLPQKLGMPERSQICLELHLDWLGEVCFAYAVVEKAGVHWDNCGRTEKGAIVRLLAQEQALRRELLDKVRRSAEDTRQRADDRLAVDLPVHYFDERRHARRGEVRDLSPTGAYIRTPRPLPSGSDVHLRFEDRRRQVMRHVRGKVVRLDFTGDVAGMGVEFRFAGFAERRAIRRLCGHLAG